MEKKEKLDAEIKSLNFFENLSLEDKEAMQEVIDTDAWRTFTDTVLKSLEDTVSREIMKKISITDWDEELNYKIIEGKRYIRNIKHFLQSVSLSNFISDKNLKEINKSLDLDIKLDFVDKPSLL